MRSCLAGPVAMLTMVGTIGVAQAQQPLIPLPPGSAMSQTAQLPPPSGPLTTPQPASSSPRIPMPAARSAPAPSAAPPSAPVMAQPVPPPSAVPVPAAPPPAAVQTAAPAQPSIKQRVRNIVGDKWTGYAYFGPAYKPEYLGAGKNTIGFHGDARVDYDGKFFAGLRDGVGLNMVNRPNFKAGPRVIYRFGREVDDSSVLTGMEDIDDSIELGGFMSYVWQQWEARMTVDKDISNAHDGMQAEARLLYQTQVSPQLSIKVGPSITWANQDYMRAYYGVTAAQAARTGYNAYDPKSSFRDVTLGVMGDYKLDEDWSINLEARLSKLLGDAAESPLVKDHGDDLQLYMGGGAKYNF